MVSEMITLFTIIMFIHLIQSCTNTKAVDCSLSATKCGIKCSCINYNITCYTDCLKCVSKTSADCCDCLFSDSTLCSGLKATKTAVNIAKYVSNAKIIEWKEIFTIQRK